MLEKNWMLGEAFAIRSKHHDSIKALWETKWRFPCVKGLYPFHDGSIADFDKVFEHLIKVRNCHPSFDVSALITPTENINDAYSDAYSEAFFPTCTSLLDQADSATAENNPALASSLYLRIACLYRISRFPIMNSA
ncbi:MAG: hypothetical protein M1830_004143, partial [Pleopsidium flavum]